MMTDSGADTTHCREPTACSDAERRRFARVVRQGFPGARDLSARIRAAKWLAFYYSGGDALKGIAALKRPDERYRRDLSQWADAPPDFADYQLELGWVFVAPTYRGRGIAKHLCRQLLALAPASRVFATTRVNNDLMIRILDALGFARVGRPFPRRGDHLVLYLRSH